MDDEMDIESQENGENGNGATDEQAPAGDIQKATPQHSPSAFLSWKNLKLTVNVDHTILHELSGYARPGRLLAIMGPSGSGKSSVLDTLAGRQPREATVGGKILLNGRKANLAYGSSAYLGQEAILLGTLTVYETLYYSAKLRFADSTSESETKFKVDSAIRDVGLQDSANTPIGTWFRRGISGGERRRVSIAVELLTSPHLLFLDEPTSGLDSASSFHVIKTLKGLAQDGDRTILCSIHQPSGEVFELFDDLCLLSSGRQIYFGPLPRALQFFERNGLPCPRLRSPSDHYLHCVNSDFDVVDKILQKQESVSRSGRRIQNAEDKPEARRRRNAEQVVDMLTQAYKESDEKKLVDSHIENISHMEGKGHDGKGSHASFLRQSAYLTMRSFVNMHRDVGYYYLRAATYVILCVCIGTIYYDLSNSYVSIQARASCFTFVVSFLSFMAIGGFPSFIEDMKVFQSERLNGHYSVAAFVIGNSLSSVLFILLITVISTAIIYPLVQLHGGFEHIVYFALNLFACLLVSEALMMTVSSVVRNFLLGIMLGAGVQGIFILVSGFFRLPNELPDPVWKYPLFYISYCSYGFQGLMENEFQGRSFQGYRPNDPPLQGNNILNSIYNIHTSRTKWINLAVLFFMVFVYRSIFFTLLTCRENLFPTIGAFISKKSVVLQSNITLMFSKPPEARPDQDIAELPGG